MEVYLLIRATIKLLERLKLLDLMLTVARLTVLLLRLNSFVIFNCSENITGVMGNNQTNLCLHFT